MYLYGRACLQGKNKCFPGFMTKEQQHLTRCLICPKIFGSNLKKKYQVFQTKVDSIVQITDGTEKFLIHLSDENVISVSC